MPDKAKLHLTNFLQPPTTELSPFTMENNQLEICNGVNLSYKLGVMTKDLGYSQIGAAIQAGKPIRGLHNFRQTAAIQKILATCDDATSDDTQLFYGTGGNWTEIGGAETAWAGKAGIDVEMEDFIGYCFFVGYGATDGFLPVGSLTGTTFSTSTNVTNMPGAKYIVRYRDRLYIANCDISATAYPYRVYFSSVPSGTISWTVATDFFDVDYSEAITGLGTNWDLLVVFTEYSAYFYNQATKKKVWDVGCCNNRTIQNYGAYMIWGDKDNIMISTSGRPQAIGNPILELYKNSTKSGLRSAVIDGEYNLYLGATSANGLSYSNCLLTYNFQANMWRWRELYDGVSTMAKYYSSGDDFLYMGMSDGEVMLKSKYKDTTPIYADDGVAISSHWRTKPLDFGDPSVLKKIDKCIFYSKLANGLNIRYRVLNKNQEALMPFKPLKTLNKVIETAEKTLSGHFIQFEGREYSTNKAWEFWGMTLQLSKDTKLK